MREGGRDVLTAAVCWGGAPGVDCWHSNHLGSQARRCLSLLCCHAAVLPRSLLFASRPLALLLPHPAGRQCYAQEPIFVPRPGGVAEDDGWVLALVFDGALERSQLVILDAQRLSGGCEKERQWRWCQCSPPGPRPSELKVAARAGNQPAAFTVVFTPLLPSSGCSWSGCYHQAAPHASHGPARQLDWQLPGAAPRRGESCCFALLRLLPVSISLACLLSLAGAGKQSKLTILPLHPFVSSASGTTRLAAAAGAGAHRVRHSQRCHARALSTEHQ